MAWGPGPLVPGCTLYNDTCFGLRLALGRCGDLLIGAKAVVDCVRVRAPSWEVPVLRRFHSTPSGSSLSSSSLRGMTSTTVTVDPQVP